ncbi:MAG: FAD-dependent monooxygenase [Chromatiales bacterium]|nr:MAG: FAD-dependent monooxygenase [Chromatiales bacterium]
MGLCAALELNHRGIRCVLLESQHEPPTDLRASTFHPPTLELLDHLDLTATLLADGLRVPQWQVRLHATHERAVFDLAVLADDTPYPFRLQYEQAAFCALGWQRAAAAEHVDFRTGVAVAQVDQDGQGVRVTAADGSSIEADWVIAADGASSRLRQLFALNFEGLTYPETTLLATTRFPFEAHLPGLSWVNYVWADDGTFSLLRVPDRWRVSLYPRDDESVERALEAEQVQARLQEIVPNAQGYEVLECRPYRIHQRILDCYRHGRVLFAGDAAHLNSPSGGMGMNCGIHDAFNLVEKLAVVLDGEPDALLDRYDRQRRPLAREEILAQADTNRRRMQQRDPAWRRAELERLQGIAAEPSAAREFLLRSSMIAGLRKAAAID